MIARCDRCDQGQPHASGYRWDPAQAGLSRFRCPECGGVLRAKRKGDHEAFITNARLKPLPPLVRKTGRLAGDVAREKKKVRDVPAGR